MADDPENGLNKIADQLREVRKHLGYPQDVGGQARISPNSSKEDYMRRLQSSVRSPRSPARHTTDGNPFDNYLLDVTEEIKQGADRLTRRLDDEREAAANVSGEVVCCIVSGIYEVLRATGGADDVDTARRATEEAVRDWLSLYREILHSLYVILEGGPLAGKMDAEVRILNIDVSALLMEIVEQALSALLFMVHELMADQARSLDGRMSRAIAKTRCAPLMRIWGAIFDFLFGGASSIIARTRLYFQDTVLKSARKRHEALDIEMVLGEELERAEYYRDNVRDLIELMDALLAALSIFSICRLSPLGNIDEEDEEGRENRPRQDEGRGTTNRTERPPRQRNTFTQQPEVRAEEIPDGYALVRRTDPVLGEIDVAIPDYRNDEEKRAASAGAAAEDMLYLTPMNTALFMHEAFGTPVDRAIALATEENCRDAVSERTEEVLQQLGILDNETE